MSLELSQIAGAVRDRDMYDKSTVQARDLYKKIISPSTSGFRAIVSAEGVPGSYVNTEDIKAADVIWGQPVLNMKRNKICFTTALISNTGTAGR